ncbi:unnamed protein product [Vitrella brassicaformis CCMP3155]|uniref:RNase NYN domain-containing protein n=2 Tax=Vitrella brassicaformis TaxID=1169539 RepID=A0A0G4ELK6_VITBC|nr:unnamed protein product [Vitrella brassicaformis CCMP3155]|mmetsp:Transcript_31559/g.91439  ORF Transcript_31559/g.91439 Transcript_31559/m.91439 type:complete len:250 (+) Transcript_31559:2-751(+)|eukprot:CEL97894.1 unnamed protein product [Vitrella brassicaformis CCMP3155]
MDTHSAAERSVAQTNDDPVNDDIRFEKTLSFERYDADSAASYHPFPQPNFEMGHRRPVLLDASNVARFSHKHKDMPPFDYKLLYRAVSWFLKRGYDKHSVRALVEDKYLRRPIATTASGAPGVPVANYEYKEKLDAIDKRILVPYAKKKVWHTGAFEGSDGGGHEGMQMPMPPGPLHSYDDIALLILANRTGGVVVTRDQYRDLLGRFPSDFDGVITKRCIGFSFDGNGCFRLEWGHRNMQFFYKFMGE